jgi:hypothetical protein
LAAAAPTPAPAPAGDPKASAAENPFAVFSETQSTAPAAGSTPTPAGGAANPAPEGAQADAKPPAEANHNEGALDYISVAMANRGAIRDYRDPLVAVNTFMNAVKAKDLAKMAEATALRAPQEASARNQKLFAAILKQELSQEDVEELAKRLNGFQFAGTNQAKSTGRLGIIFTKPEGTSIMNRTITMRLEKAGWKVVDISGQREMEKPVMIPNMRRGMGGRR